MLDIRVLAADILKDLIEELEIDDIRLMLEYPPEEDMGDLALPCFKLSRILRKSPVAIAEELASRIPENDDFKRVEAKSGYLNFFLNRETFMEKVLSKAIDDDRIYGSSKMGKGKNIVIDYSAPNIAKPFHIGHLRSTAIGNALYNIFEFLGYKSIGVNHLGDWGTQFGKLIVAYKNWGSKEAIEEGGIKELMSIYVKFHQEAEKDPSLDDEARDWFVKMEKGDEEALELWQWIKDISLEEFERIYKLLDMSFDSYAGESFYEDKMPRVIKELEDKNLMSESQGAMIIDLEDYNMPPCLIIKKDGSTLYATRDITAAIYRKETYDFHKCIYTTAAAQSLHFAQWFKVIELMGYDWHDKLVHVPFGLVSLGGEKIATREGKVVLLEEILDEAIKKTRAIIEERNPNLEDKEAVARDMGVGAVIFNDLYSNRIKDVSFSWDEVLNFDGETGPYVQYTHARTCSLLRRVDNEVSKDFDPSLLNTREEFNLVKELYLFPHKVISAMEDLEPSVITRYLVDLAQSFNRFYHEHSILVEDENLKNSRLALVLAVNRALKNGLKLIGLKAPSRV